MFTDRIKMLLLTGLGTGRMPFVPGTWASGLAVLLWLAAAWLLDGHLLWLNVLTLLAAAGATAACIAFAPLAIQASGNKDPRPVVADEWAGQWVALLGMSWLAFRSGAVLNVLLGVAFVQFVLFRLFDIFKPWPCRRLERLPAGTGIAVDDLMAGAYANLAGWIIQLIYLAARP